MRQDKGQRRPPKKDQIMLSIAPLDLSPCLCPVSAIHGLAKSREYQRAPRIH